MIYNYVPPNEQELETARDALQQLTLASNGDESIQHFITDSRQEEPIEIPAAAIAILSDVLKFMSQGHGLTLFPRLAEVTTMEAADILNVSRPYVIKLLEEGAMPYRMVGRHRRIRLKDVIEYKNRIDQEREAFLDRLVAESQELGLYD